VLRCGVAPPGELVGAVQPVCGHTGGGAGFVEQVVSLQLLLVDGNFVVIRRATAQRKTKALEQVFGNKGQRLDDAVRIARLCIAT
jgi:hypothetical protein